MATSNTGGAFGFLRGKVGGVVFSVLKASASSTGKKQQSVRSMPESVANPQTAAQTMQRMKAVPAAKFYAAFKELLSNAFQGVAYGDPSRRYFLSLAMSQDGPYIQRGVDRFIPARYPFTRGSLPTVPISPFNGGASVITLGITSELETLTNAQFAEALGVSDSTQITVAVVNNVNGIMVPSYVGFEDRLRIADLPAGTVGVSDGNITINPAVLGLDMSAMVACCVALSEQDASGSWLRSSQDMVISRELAVEIYGPDALNAAIASYQDETASNGVNSPWYYNLGLTQAYDGKIVTFSTGVYPDGTLASPLAGVREENGVITYEGFAVGLENDDLVCVVINGVVTTVPGYTISYAREHGWDVDFNLYQPVFATQGGFSNGVVTEEAVTLYYSTSGDTEGSLVNAQGQQLALTVGGVKKKFNRNSSGFFEVSSNALTSAISIHEVDSMPDTFEYEGYTFQWSEVYEISPTVNAL